ncbi:MAG: glycoside hydrolase family 25 protein [Candidatus Limnocylindrales bacterium]
MTESPAPLERVSATPAGPTVRNWMGREQQGESTFARTWRDLAARALLFGALVLALAVAPATASQPAYMKAIDVSHWQRSPDWPAVKADGVQFAIAKATQGQTFVDGEYARNRAQSDSLGLAFTAYHFASPDNTRNDAVREADHFLATAALAGRHLVPVLDLEGKAGGLGPRKLTAWTKAWLGRVQQQLGVKPMIYANPSFWVNRMGNSRWFADNGYRLWIAHWGATQPTVPAQNWGGRGWTLWQHSNKGSVAGINGDVDLGRYIGTSLDPLRIKNNR